MSSSLPARVWTPNGPKPKRRLASALSASAWRAIQTLHFLLHLHFLHSRPTRIPLPYTLPFLHHLCRPAPPTSTETYEHSVNTSRRPTSHRPSTQTFTLQAEPSIPVLCPLPPSISSSVTIWYSERLLQSFVHKYTTLAPQQLSPNTTKLAGLHYLAYTFIRPLLGPKFRVFVGGDLKPP